MTIRAAPKAPLTPAKMTKRAVKRVVAREAILDAAEALFLSHGFLGARIDEICARTPYTKGAIYFYFKDKEAILMEVLARVRAVVLEPLLVAATLNGSSPGETLIRYLQQQAKIANESSSKLLMTILLSIELNGTHSKSASSVNGGYTKLALALEAIISAGQKSGEFRGDLPARELASLVLALNDGVMLQWMRQRRVINEAELIRATRSVLWSGIAASRNDGIRMPSALMTASIETRGKKEK
jgi:AcrR family transcriptional regulator